MELISNFGMREWLISCGIVLVLVVLLDGFRRMRAERKGEIKMSLRMGGEFPEGSEDDFGVTELPNGGARVVGRAEPSGNVEQAEQPLDDYSEGAYQQTLPDSDVAINSEEQSEWQRQSDSDLVPEAQLIVMHAKSKEEDGFNGSDLLEVLLACDCRYGDRDILHRYEHTGGHGQLQFSVANMVEPGTFSLEDISSFRTPGVTFFMTLPGAENPVEAFDCMLETANCLAKNLEASLLDDSHAVLSEATVDEYRSRASAFSNVTT